MCVCVHLQSFIGSIACSGLTVIKLENFLKDFATSICFQYQRIIVG